MGTAPQEAAGFESRVAPGGVCFQPVMPSAQRRDVARTGGPALGSRDAVVGVALGGWISSLFSSKKLLKDGIEPNNGLKKRLLKDSYTEMSNKLAS